MFKKLKRLNKLKTLIAILFAPNYMMAQQPAHADLATFEAGKKEYETLCAGCHGADGAGGERGPGIITSSGARPRSQQELRELIRVGIPAAGMPGFDLPEEQLGTLLAYVRSLSVPAIESPVSGDVVAGEAFFFDKGKCATCHMIRGRGGWVGPDLSNLGVDRTLVGIEQALQNPSSRIATGYQMAVVRLRTNRTLRGLVKNESNYDIQLQSLDGKLHLLRREEIASLKREKESLMPPLQTSEEELRNLLALLSRLSGTDSILSGRKPIPPVEEPPGNVTFSDLAQPKPGNWPTYHGHLSGNRHSLLRQIHTGNVATLAPQWIFSIPASPRLEVTPVVVDGVMYVTSANEAYALDARSGRQIWHYRRPRTKGLVGDAAGGINRGVGVLGNRVFMVTDNAHLIALHRLSGQLLWDVEMADYRENYGATSAPLVVKDLVISGTSGGDEGVRGFIAAYRASTGERAWRFWTIPAPGEPLSETWIGRALSHGCAAAWLTGTYDPENNLLYWTTGNPCPDYNGDERMGDNFYSDSIVALKADTGELQWYYQYTPHDLHDWDAEQTPMLIDRDFQRQPRRLLVQANRNGFFYVLDRTNGKLLLATPFVQKLTWSSGIGPDGRPKIEPDTDPTPQGVKVCPSVEGATNWMSTAYNPVTGLFYVMALEKCSIYSKSSAVWEPGKSFYNGATREVPGESGQKYLRAIDPQTGKIVWEYAQAGPANSWGGVLSTAGGLVFFGDDSGAFAAIDAKTGKQLWHFHTSQIWKASPMTYVAGGKQFVAIASGSNILAFGLPEPKRSH